MIYSTLTYYKESNILSIDKIETNIFINKKPFRTISDLIDRLSLTHTPLINTDKHISFKLPTHKLHQILTDDEETIIESKDNFTLNLYSPRFELEELKQLIAQSSSYLSPYENIITFLERSRSIKSILRLLTDRLERGMDSIYTDPTHPLHERLMKLSERNITFCWKQINNKD